MRWGFGRLWLFEIFGRFGRVFIKARRRLGIILDVPATARVILSAVEDDGEDAHHKAVEQVKKDELKCSGEGVRMP
jgi:hypothetical protein